MDDKIIAMNMDALNEVIQLMEQHDSLYFITDTRTVYDECLNSLKGIRDGLIKEELQPTPSGIISIICLQLYLSVNAYLEYTFEPTFQKLLGSNYKIDETAISDEFVDNWDCIQLTTKEIFYGLKLISDDAVTHHILAQHDGAYDEAYEAFRKDALDEFTIVIKQNDGAREIYSNAISVTILKLYCAECFSFSDAQYDEMINNYGKTFTHLSEQFFPSLELAKQQYQCFCNLADKECEDSGIENVYETFKQTCAKAITEHHDLLSFLTGMYKMPKSMRNQLGNDLEQNILIDINSTNSPVDCTGLVDESFYMGDVFSNIVLKKIRQYMKENSTGIVEDRNYTTVKFDKFLDDNIIILNDFSKPFNNRYKKLIVELIDNIKTTKSLYAFMYLLFPITPKKGKGDEAEKNRIQTKSILWKSTPIDTHDAVTRFVKYFDEFKNLINPNSEDTKPNKQRKLLINYIHKDKMSWILDYIVCAWNKKANNVFQENINNTKRD